MRKWLPRAPAAFCRGSARRSVSAGPAGSGPPADADLLRAAAADVFLPGVATDEGPYPLAAEDAHHLVRVLRLRAGDLVTAADGEGSWRPCRLHLRPGADPLLDPDGPVVTTDPELPVLTVAVALPKGDRGDWAVQKLTEVGADVIVPLLASRSVVRLSGERAPRAAARLERICRAAAMQSRRIRLPMVGEPADPAGLAAANPGRVGAAEPGGGPPDLAHPVVLVGPEGGWAPGELAPDLPRIGLGPRVLRTETAAVAVATALALLRAGLVAPAGRGSGGAGGGSGGGAREGRREG